MSEQQEFRSQETEARRFFLLNSVFTIPCFTLEPETCNLELVT
jgi:hypothetical protein